MRKYIGILFLTITMGGSAFGQVVSQPSIDQSDFTFVKVTPIELPFLRGEKYILFSLCNEQPVDCNLIGQGIYALDALKTYRLKNPKTAGWVFQPGVLEGQNVILASEPIETYLEVLRTTLESMASQPRQFSISEDNN